MKRTPYTLNDAIKVANEHGGICLSSSYKNSTTKLWWQCSKGHSFRSSLASAKLGHWCNRCSHKRTAEKLRGNITEMVTIARQRGGICLSKVYINSATKLDWQCSKGHVWQAIPSKVKYGSWCMRCAGIAPLTIKEMQEIAKSKGGKCLSKKYINGRTKLSWKCGSRHKWTATPDNVKNGSWCPDCSEGLGERICRIYFESLFHDEFKSVWPNWLRNRHGEKLQLDGYSEKLGLAFEHDGLQHHRYVKFFHRTKQEYRRRRADDRLKDELCKAHGVTLIRIQTVPSVINIDNLKDFIGNQCRSKDFVLPPEFEKTEIDLTKAYKPDSRLIQYKKYVEERRGKLLSKSYLGSQLKLLHLCEEGHKFEMRPDSVKQGQWCPICARPLPITLKEMKALARERGGRCLSKNVVDTQTLLWWQCEKKHPKWLAPPSRIKAGSWCLPCARIATGQLKRLNMDKMHELARERGGICLSEKYTTNKEKLLWQCGKGHLPWKAAPGMIQVGTWCPECGIIEREQKRKMLGGWPGAVARQIDWRTYSEAKEFVFTLGLKSQNEWRKWIKGRFGKLPRRPKDIPANPDKIYKNNGWVSMGDWLGTGRIADQLKNYRDFQPAREWAHSLKLKGEGEWRLYLQAKVIGLPMKPEDIPASPNNTYKNSGWSGWGDWLGTGNKFTHQMNYRSFDEARQFARGLNLKSRTEWNLFCKNQIVRKYDKPNDIPKTPWTVYQDKGWIGMNDWLGK